ncbi:MAG: hypothetical protein GC178_05970 [Flavobacteriales bacterium]|nr:hypothetical protein [Flavobacteriales bacterium]
MSSVPNNINLNNHQLEILKLFSREMDEKDFIAIKRLIVAYLGSKVTDMADKVWEKDNWSDDRVEELLNSYERSSKKKK